MNLADYSLYYWTIFMFIDLSMADVLDEIVQTVLAICWMSE